MRLERFGPDDRALYESLIFNEEVMRMNLGRGFTPEEAGMFFRVILEEDLPDGLYGWFKVYVPREGTEVFIGTGTLDMNEEFGAPEIGYMLLPPYWGCGYGTELAGVLAGMAETHLPCTDIITITDPGNTGSKKILERNGFRSEKCFLNADGATAELFRKAGNIRKTGTELKNAGGSRALRFRRKRAKKVERFCFRARYTVPAGRTEQWKSRGERSAGCRNTSGPTSANRSPWRTSPGRQPSLPGTQGSCSSGISG